MKLKVRAHREPECPLVMRVFSRFPVNITMKCYDSITCCNHENLTHRTQHKWGGYILRPQGVYNLWPPEFLFFLAIWYDTLKNYAHVLFRICVPQLNSSSSSLNDSFVPFFWGADLAARPMAFFHCFHSSPPVSGQFGKIKVIPAIMMLYFLHFVSMIS